MHCCDETNCFACRFANLRLFLSIHKHHEKCQMPSWSAYIQYNWSSHLPNTTYYSGTKGHITKLTQELELPPLQERRKNLRLAYVYRVVEGLVPALAPEHYFVTRKPGRGIKAKLFADYQATNVVETQSINNTKGFTVPQAHSGLYKNSFLVRTIIDWNHLDEDLISAPSVESFKSRLAHQSCQ